MHDNLATACLALSRPPSNYLPTHKEFRHHGSYKFLNFYPMYIYEVSHTDYFPDRKCTHNISCCFFFQLSKQYSKIRFRIF